VRHIAALIEGVVVAESPQWLKEALESIGQRSINNIVDATNFVMLDIGQPMHAFDADYLRDAQQDIHLNIRAARNGDKLQTLSGEEYTLAENMYVISNGATGEALDIAGVKGGMHSGVRQTTKNIVISVGTYDGELVRKACQRLSLHTDASQRYQNRPSPQLGAYGMRDIVALILDIAGGTLIGGVDIFNGSAASKSVVVTADKTSRLLGAFYSHADVASSLTRLDLPFVQKDATFTVTPPFERTDIAISEDLVEEVGRLVGYDHVKPQLLPTQRVSALPQFVQTLEAIRDALVQEGCIEISSYSLVSHGDIQLEKPLADDKKYLRTDLYEGHRAALETNAAHMPLYNLSDLRLFELGRVWPNGREVTVLGISYWNPAKDGAAKRDAFFIRMDELLSHVCGVAVRGAVRENTWQCTLDDAFLASTTASFNPQVIALGQFKSFSSYPYALRDVAVWTPEGTPSNHVQSIVEVAAGELLIRIDLHDVFTKDGRTSYMFKMVFQAFDRTLTDLELTAIMDRITTALHAQTGYSVR
jgi:phenylalanyl-tRNA synthetase beta chain